jgi:hypothetical protein|tara:strand:+ start:345 stop:572 length:228 start_codon:yes stop_codon:yes gene_type:complete
MGVKEWLGIGSLIITLLGFAIFQGKLIERINVLESQQSVDIKPLTADIAVNKAEIAVLNAKVNEMKARSDNPLGQ